jgi:hypothetical protein
MLYSLYSQVSIIALVLICGLAIRKGALAERMGAVMILATWIVTLVVSLAAPRHHFPASGFLVSDAILATGLLVLALRYSSWWLGAAMLLQAVGLSLQAIYFTYERADIGLAGNELLAAKRFLVLGKNLASLAMLLVLLAATIATIVKRRRSSVRPLGLRSVEFPARAAG